MKFLGTILQHLTFTAFFGVSIYLFASTASITSEYLPSAGWLMLFHPILVSVLFFAVWRVQSLSRVRALGLLGNGLVLCCALFVALLLYREVEISRPDTSLEKTFGNTVFLSMCYPQFSNRSYGVAVWAAAGHTLIWALSQLGYVPRNQKIEQVVPPKFDRAGG